jgi:hypothetical protein
MLNYDLNRYLPFEFPVVTEELHAHPTRRNWDAVLHHKTCLHPNSKKHLVLWGEEQEAQRAEI